MLEDNRFKVHSFYNMESMLGMYGLRDRVSLNLELSFPRLVDNGKGFVDGRFVN